MNSGISKGHLVRSNNAIIQPIVWLTTDPNPQGHGLPTGQENVTDEQLRHHEHVTGKRALTRITVDKTAVRIKVKISSSDKNLISFRQFANKNEPRPEIYTKITGLSAILDIQSLSDLELQSALKTAKTNEDTWWLYRGIISPTLFEDVDFRIDENFVKYDFEKYGREHFLDQGMAAVSAASLSDLARLIPATNKFDIPKAFCVCTELGALPSVIIRGNGFDALFSIDEGRVIQCPENMDPRNLIQWITAHKDELASCWNQARERFMFYNNID